MVTRGPHRANGSSTTGCLLSLLIVLAVLYYGLRVGEVYWRYYQLRDEMQVNARLAPGLTDDVIQRRLAAKVSELFGPDRTMQFRISRGTRVRSIVIETEYRDSVSLPLFQRGFTLRPRAEEPL